MLNETLLLAAEWIHLVTGSILTVKNFESILNVDSVTTWSRADELASFFSYQLNDRLHTI